MNDDRERIMLPWSRSCFVCGEENERGMRARSYIAGEWIELPFTAPSSFAGWRTVIHGGLVATVLDEVMTWASIVGSRKPCFAAEIKVRMLRPLAPGTECVARARMTDNKKKVFFTEGVLEAKGGEVFARSEGRYMVAPPEKLQEFRDDFVSGEDCHDISDVLGPD